jgi:hypothetical protein
MMREAKGRECSMEKKSVIGVYTIPGFHIRWKDDIERIS